MTVGALIDAGASPERIEEELKKLNVSGYKLEWKTVVKEGISATKFDVILEGEDAGGHHSHDHDHHHQGHHHDHDHEHGHHHHDHGHHDHTHGHDHHHDHSHSHSHGHHHDHAHSHSHNHSHHLHSRYADIVKLIDESELSSRVKERSKQIFVADCRI